MANNLCTIAQVEAFDRAGSRDRSNTGWYRLQYIHKTESSVRGLSVMSVVSYRLIRFLLQNKVVSHQDTDTESSSEAILDIQKLNKLISYYKLTEWVVFDPTVALSHGYYTGIVFQAVDRNDPTNVIC